MPLNPTPNTMVIQSQNRCMAPSKRVSGDNVVDVLRDIERPYATTTDIAEGLDVTAQTVRNNASELAKDARINKGKVGQSSVYWLADEDEPPASRDVEPVDRSHSVRTGEKDTEHTTEETAGKDEIEPKKEVREERLEQAQIPHPVIVLTVIGGSFGAVTMFAIMNLNLGLLTFEAVALFFLSWIGIFVTYSGILLMWPHLHRSEVSDSTSAEVDSQ